MRFGLALLAIAIAAGACSKVERTETPQTASPRIVSLAPNLTELLFSVGAGEHLVGVSAWSDYPREVLQLPVVGDAFGIDHEQLTLLSPDVLLVWESGTPAHVIDNLQSLGYQVEAISTSSLDDIAVALRRLGRLTDNVQTADAVAREFQITLRDLRAEYASAEKIRVFYQVASRPLYTINSEHYISELVSLCGGENVFSDLSELAPAVDVEAVIDRRPEVMLASTDAGDDAFDVWQQWPKIPAVAYGNQYLLPADEIGRATTRVIVAAKALCLALQQARTNRDRATDHE